MNTVSKPLITLNEAIKARLAEQERKRAEAEAEKKRIAGILERNLAIFKVELIKRIARDFGVEISLTEAAKWDCQINPREDDPTAIERVSVIIPLHPGQIYVQAPTYYVWLSMADIQGSEPLVYRAHIDGYDDMYDGPDFIEAAAFTQRRGTHLF